MPYKKNSGSFLAAILYWGKGYTFYLLKHKQKKAHQYPGIVVNIGQVHLPRQTQELSHQDSNMPPSQKAKIQHIKCFCFNNTATFKIY